MVRAAAIKVAISVEVFLTERLLTVSVANTDNDLIGCQLYSINTLNDETLGAYGI